MSERLPDFVVCCACDQPVRLKDSKRYVTQWCDPRGGGTLSGVEDQKAHDVYRCKPCIRIGRMPNQPVIEQEAFL